MEAPIFLSFITFHTTLRTARPTPDAVGPPRMCVRYGSCIRGKNSWASSLSTPPWAWYPTLLTCLEYVCDRVCEQKKKILELRDLPHHLAPSAITRRCSTAYNLQTVSHTILAPATCVDVCDLMRVRLRRDVPRIYVYVCVKSFVGWCNYVRDTTHAYACSFSRGNTHAHTQGGVGDATSVQKKMKKLKLWHFKIFRCHITNATSPLYGFRWEDSGYDYIKYTEYFLREFIALVEIQHPHYTHRHTHTDIDRFNMNVT